MGVRAVDPLVGLRVGARAMVRAGLLGARPEISHCCFCSSAIPIPSALWVASWRARGLPKGTCEGPRARGQHSRLG